MGQTIREKLNEFMNSPVEELSTVYERDPDTKEITSSVTKKRYIEQAARNESDKIFTTAEIAELSARLKGRKAATQVPVAFTNDMRDLILSAIVETARMLARKSTRDLAVLKSRIEALESVADTTTDK